MLCYTIREQPDSAARPGFGLACYTCTRVIGPKRLSCDATNLVPFSCLRFARLLLASLTACFWFGVRIATALSVHAAHCPPMPKKSKPPPPAPLQAQGKGQKKRTPTSSFDAAAGKDIYEPEKIVAQRTVKGVTTAPPTAPPRPHPPPPPLQRTRRSTRRLA